MLLDYYSRTIWKNDVAPSISAENLNNIEKAVETNRNTIMEMNGVIRAVDSGKFDEFRNNLEASNEVHKEANKLYNKIISVDLRIGETEKQIAEAKEEVGILQKKTQNSANEAEWRAESAWDAYSLTSRKKDEILALSEPIIRVGSEIKISETNAKTSETNAKISENNAKVSENNIKDVEEKAKELLLQASNKVADTEFEVDLQDGHLYYQSKSFSFSLDEDTGILSYE